MLSRAAERMYWFGRYLERAENTALLINVNTRIVMDLPARVDHIWASLIDITGEEADYFERYSKISEPNIMKYLLDGERCSIRNAVQMARENARTSREILPSDAWEKVNRLHHFIDANSAGALPRKGRDVYLKEVVNRCQELTGYLVGCMSNSAAYNFIKIGRNLERADMTSRILDIGCLNLNSSSDSDSGPNREMGKNIQEFEDLLWTSLLLSLSGYQMYRQHVGVRINGRDVADFLLHNAEFPRSVGHCLNQVVMNTALLPRNDAPWREVSDTRDKLASANIIKIYSEGGLHDFVDSMQQTFSSIHQEIANTWFVQSAN